MEKLNVKEKSYIRNTYFSKIYIPKYAFDTAWGEFYSIDRGVIWSS